MARVVDPDLDRAATPRAPVLSSDAAAKADGGDPREAWLDRHHRAAWRFARLLGASDDVAADLAQDALLAALHKRVEQRNDGEAAAWLRAAVRNLWREHLRRQRRRPAHVELEVAEQAMLRHGGRGDGGDGAIEALRRCVEALDGRARAAIELRYRDGASRVQLAERLGLGEQGVKTLLRRTREVLMACVRRRQQDNEA
ncbi:MAG: sigma-70 family RNA polymerase sigma factor [Planctomycetota bacterium]